MPKCKICGGDVVRNYMPMREWGIDGPICGRCYSAKIYEHYPGEHVRAGDGA